MPRRNDAVYLKHLRDAIRQIETYTSGIDEAAFSRNRLVQDAVIRQLMVIGEAAAQLSPAFRARHGDWPWREIKGMRNILVHEYDSISIRTVWRAIRSDLPSLRAAVDRAIEHDQSDER